MTIPAQSLPASAAPAIRRARGDDLVRRARAGDRVAFGLLYERHAPEVHAVLLGIVRPAEARDLLQEAFLAALARLEQLAEDERFPAWVVAIARNRALDLLRSAGRRRPFGDVEAAEVHAPCAAPAAEEAELVLDAIRSLPAAYRTTLLLRLVEGLKGPEIAARTGMTHGSVRVNLCRGMKLLRHKLRGEAP